MFDSQIIDRVGWTLVHSLWQIALLGYVVATCNRSMFRSSANGRYVTGCIGLLFAVIAPAITFMTIESTAGNGSRIVASETGTVPSRVVGEPPSEFVDPQDDPPLASGNAQARTEIPSQRSVTFDDGSLAIGEKQELERATSISQAVIAWRHRLSASLALVIQWIVAGWLAGVLLLCARPLSGLWTVWRVQRIGRSKASEEVAAIVCRLSERMKITRLVEVAESALLEVPAVVGVLRPLLLLPATFGTGLTPQQLEAIVAHELAHIRRHDYLVNVLQTFVETLLFYHPAVWWVSHCVRQEREHVCDDMAVAICVDRTEYGHALVALDSLRRAPRTALAANGGSLLKRIRRIVNGEPTQSLSPWPAMLALLVTVGIVGGVMWPNDGDSAIAADELQNEPPLNIIGDGVGRVTFSPDGQRIATSRRDGKVDVRNSPQGNRDYTKADATQPRTNAPSEERSENVHGEDRRLYIQILNGIRARVSAGTATEFSVIDANQLTDRAWRKSHRGQLVRLAQELLKTPTSDPGWADHRAAGCKLFELVGRREDYPLLKKHCTWIWDCGPDGHRASKAYVRAGMTMLGDYARASKVDELARLTGYKTNDPDPLMICSLLAERADFRPDGWEYWLEQELREMSPHVRLAATQVLTKESRLLHGNAHDNDLLHYFKINMLDRDWSTTYSKSSSAKTFPQLQIASLKVARRVASPAMAPQIERVLNSSTDKAVLTAAQAAMDACRPDTPNASIQRVTNKDRQSADAREQKLERHEDGEQLETEDDQRDAMHQAIGSGNLEAVKKLLPHVNLKYISGHVLVTPNPEVFRLLSERLSEQKIYFHRAVKATVLGDRQWIEQWIRAEPPTGKQLDHLELVRLAAIHNRPELIELLVQHGANTDYHLNPTRITPLAEAAERGSIEAMEKLIALHANVNLLADYTPLQRACIGKQPKAAALLLKHGANPNTARHDSQTALHLAAKVGAVGCVKLLLKRGADPKAEAYNHDTALSYAERHKHDDVASVLREASKSRSGDSKEQIR